MSGSTVHLIDDDEAVRGSLSLLLEAADFEVVTYESAEAFLCNLDGIEDGCVVTDVRMPGMSGMDLVYQLQDLGSALPVVVITGHGDIGMAVEALRAGVCDFIEKPFDHGAILRALDLAFARAAGDTDRIDAERRQAKARRAGLSAVERDVLGSLIAGRTEKQIAQDMGLRPEQAAVHRAQVMTKMKATSLLDLVRIALLAEG